MELSTTRRFPPPVRTVAMTPILTRFTLYSVRVVRALYMSPVLAMLKTSGILCSITVCDIIQTLIRDDVIWLVDLGCDLIRQYSLLTKSANFHSDQLGPVTKSANFHLDQLTQVESHLRSSQPRPIHRIGSAKVLLAIWPSSSSS